ncbi:MAG: hypothetical protein LBG42_06035, partial [Treponema sp.]|nr:hypothetical protein [Treponema sp.]
AAVGDGGAVHRVPGGDGPFPQGKAEGGFRYASGKALGEDPAGPGAGDGVGDTGREGRAGFDVPGRAPGRLPACGRLMMTFPSPPPVGLAQEAARMIGNRRRLLNAQRKRR